MPTIKIYCDGAVSNNGCENAVGGYAYIVIEDGLIVKEDGCDERNTTSQRMELKALICSLKECVARGANDPFPCQSFTIYSDSAYCVNCIKNSWWRSWISNGWLTSKKQPVANRDLWEQIIPYLSNPNIKIEKIKGHTGVKDYNSIVDALAVSYKISAM